MKNCFLEFAKVTGVMALTFFVSMLVWANWKEPQKSLYVCLGGNGAISAVIDQ